MRVTTVTIFSLLALLAPGLTKKANAAFESKPFVQEQYRRDFAAPADPGASALPEANSQGDMFNKPFYAGEQKPVRKEKTISAEQTAQKLPPYSSGCKFTVSRSARSTVPMVLAPHRLSVLFSSLSG